MTSNVRTGGVVFATLIVAATAASPLAGQRALSFEQTTHLTVGYVISPEQLLGFSVMTVGPKWGGWGLMASFRTSTDSPADEPTFQPDMTVADAQAIFADEFSQDSDWTTFDLALVRTVTPDLALYAGGGYSERTVYREFLRSGAQQGTFFWLRDRNVKKEHVNITAGGFLRVMDAFLFQIGFGTAPRGPTAGVSLGFAIGG